MLEDRVAAEPIYKGATRPPTIFGVPLMPLLLVAGGGFLAGMYLLVYATIAWAALVAGAVFPLLLWMRMVTKRDDQRLGQILLTIRLALACPNRHFWQCRSYSSLVYRGSRDAWRR
ncbi:Type IV secretory pathway VirB3 family protein [Burkholderiales bacterium]|nr:Type IV secretory pathway VirB3 family protein [Burkholderiales bacterium]